LAQPGFVVASTANNRPLADLPAFSSETHARDYFNQAIRKNPAMAEDIHVISTFEATL
jgi:hypothetical protein